MADSKEFFFVLGRLTRPHGIRGEIRADYYAESTALLDGRLFLRAGNGEPRPLTVLSWREQGSALILRLEGVASRSQAEFLRGCEILAAREDMPEEEEDAPYLAHILGMEVFLEDGRRLGVIEDILFPAGQELWSIRTNGSASGSADGSADDSADSSFCGEEAAPGEKTANTPANICEGIEILFPAVPDFVKSYDLNAGRVTILPPPGLLEVYLENAGSAAPKSEASEPETRRTPIREQNRARAGHEPRNGTAS